jgi:hypothetical protein
MNIQFYNIRLRLSSLNYFHLLFNIVISFSSQIRKLIIFLQIPLNVIGFVLQSEIQEDSIDHIFSIVELYGINQLDTYSMCVCVFLSTYLSKSFYFHFSKKKIKSIIHETTYFCPNDIIFQNRFEIYNSR